MGIAPDRNIGRPVAQARVRRHARATRHADHLSQLGVEVAASRLRILGHPTRLRILRSLDRRASTIEQLAAELGIADATVRAHLNVLHRAGIIARVDDNRAGVYQLTDWASLWLIDQLALRLRDGATGLGEHDPEEEACW
jgi:ArsR family transcriptional regulator